jgi:hypothetical protein
MLKIIVNTSGRNRLLQLIKTDDALVSHADRMIGEFVCE